MNLMDAFRRTCVRIDGDIKTKDAALRNIADMAVETGMAGDYSVDDIYHALEKRERVGSTGFENGIAIPHCGLENTEEFIAGILLVPSGIDFHSSDGKPSRIIAFIVGPKEERNRHIQLLSAVSRMLSDEAIKEEFVRAGSEDDLWLLLVRHIGELEGVAAPREPKPKNLFIIVIQREECFDDILKIFSAAVHGSITVVESANAGYYLHHMPLFASYWTDSGSKFNRVIIGVVDRDVSNDVIRRINTRVGNIAEQPGVLVAVQELTYTNGLIDF